MLTLLLLIVFICLIPVGVSSAARLDSWVARRLKS
jgi:hypothetical protein